MDLEIRKFQLSISEYVEKSELPEEIKKIILADILAKVTKKADLAVSEQLAAEEEKEDAESVQQN